MHADTRELIAIRDGEPVDAQAAAHVPECASCAQALQQLGKMRDALRTLPGEAPPEALWLRIADARALETMAESASVRRSYGRAAAVLALAFVTVGVVFHMRAQGPVDVATTERGVVVPEVASLASLQQQSRDLESLLQRYRMPAVMSLTTASAINDIEDSIAMIDERLSDPNIEREQQRLLWERRVDLMEALMTVRAAERRAGSI